MFLYGLSQVEFLVDVPVTFFDDSLPGKTWEDLRYFQLQQFVVQSFKSPFINTENIHFIDVWIRYNRLHLMKLPNLVYENRKTSSAYTICHFFVISH